jgi:dTDP-4-amino-4,6-dideoxygalactose transaminase
MMLPVVTQRDRWELCLHLEKRGIETRPMMPITNQPCYNFVEDHYPVAKNINENGFYIPCHPGMDEEDVGYVGEAVESFFAERKKARQVSVAPVAGHVGRNDTEAVDAELASKT